jgi:hypothetical protein
MAILTDLMNWKGWGIVGVLVSIFVTIAALLGLEVKRMPEIDSGTPVDRAGGSREGQGSGMPYCHFY